MLQLRSLITADGELRLSLDEVAMPEPASHEVVVKIGATPINPSDLGLLLGPADLTTLRVDGGVTSASVPASAMALVAARVGESMPVGNEAGGVVVAAGSSPAAQALLGRTVGAIGGAMYAEYRAVAAMACIPMPQGVTAREAASCFVNPLTALSMVENMRMEGHTALVHTAAASNLGQMLVRICQADGVGLVNVVRRPEQAELLRSIGATHVVDSSSDNFRSELVEALTATGATLAFDATGGGTLAGEILVAMERAASAGQEYSRYGSSTHKQVYVYGRLDLRPLELRGGNFGFAWGIGGWLLTPFLGRLAPERAAELRARVAAEITTTFASQYSAEITLQQALEPDHIRTYAEKSTGSKFLIVPRG
jgi:NADPH:quinone reductase